MQLGPAITRHASTSAAKSSSATGVALGAGVAVGAGDSVASGVGAAVAMTAPPGWPAVGLERAPGVTVVADGSSSPERGRRMKTTVMMRIRAAGMRSCSNVGSDIAPSVLHAPRQRVPTETSKVVVLARSPLRVTRTSYVPGVSPSNGKNV